MDLYPGERRDFIFVQLKNTISCIGASAILVRRHGIYVWGDNWQKAKAQYVFF